MIKIKHRLFFVLFFFVFSIVWGRTPPSRRSANGTRIHLGPVIGFYSVNSKHARTPYPKFGIEAGFKREVNIDRDYHAYFLFGISYFYHGLNFNSYYFAPGAVKVYDKTFSYKYSLSIHELDLPLQVKYLFNREDNSLFSPYVTAAYQVRFLVDSRLNVTQNGAEIKNDAPVLKFKTPFLYEKINSFVSAGIGWQKNSLSSSKGSFFVELDFLYGFSPYYFETDYSASSLFIGSTHLSLQLGLKF